MSAREEIIDKLNRLKVQAENAHVQGRRPEDVPLSVRDGLDIVGMLLILVTHYDNHHHDITISKKERETTGPL